VIRSIQQRIPNSIVVKSEVSKNLARSAWMVGMERVWRMRRGNIVEQRDSKGALVGHSYDALNRTIRM
jgi:hypothetical protein